MRTIGKYQVVEEIGRGGMGAVFRARDPLLDRDVAIKTLFTGGWVDADARERFFREARSAARLQHPNIITIFELGEADGSPFIAMELLHGHDLVGLQEKGGLDDLGTKLLVVEQLCRALAHAHAHGVTHRDIKPSNVFVQRDGTVKVVDFGIARFEGCSFATRDGAVLGTPWYMAPEQFTGEAVDHRVDIWAVGVILYELVTGVRPFDADTVASLIYRIINSPLAGFDPQRFGAPPALLKVIQKALAKASADRYQDMAEMADDLRRILTSPSGPAARAADTDNMATGPLETSVGQRAAMQQSTAAMTPAPVPAATTPPSATVQEPVQRTVVEQPSPARTRPATGGFREAGIFGERAGLQVIAADPDEEYLAVGGVDGSIRLWDLATRMKTQTLRSRMHLRTGHAAMTRVLAFSADGTYLAAGHLDGAIYIWQQATGLELETTLRHEGAVAGFGFTPDTTVLASGGVDATLKLWEMDAVLGGEARRLMRRQPAEVTCLLVAPSGGSVVTGHTNRSIRVTDIHSGRLLATLHGGRSSPSCLALSADGSTLASGWRDGAVRIFDLESRAQLTLIQAYSRSICSICFLPGGELLATAAMENNLAIWETGGGNQITTLWGGAGESFASLAMLGSSASLLCGLSDGRVRVWEMG